MRKVLSIAGSDCSGGAGIQADLKTMTAHKTYGMTAITALTVQNTVGVFDVLDVSPEFVKAQIDAVFTDIYPDAIKIGMVSNHQIIASISERLLFYKAKQIVVDPVMVATSGSKLLSTDAIHALKTTLLPIATVLTPNIPEAEVLCGFPIVSQEDMLRAARTMSDLFHTAILLKGGHLQETADDILLVDGHVHWLPGIRIHNPNTHGTGCTLSTALACNLANGMSLVEAAQSAKQYVAKALASGLNLGRGSGPIDHCVNIEVALK
jgi:hydroxymethylpyrimidine/phosphomethylpyrimidine kinase